jgi:hypothetical protein
VTGRQPDNFSWPQGYGAFSVSVSQLPGNQAVRAGTKAIRPSKLDWVGERAFSRYPNHQRGRVVAAGRLQ